MGEREQLTWPDGREFKWSEDDDWEMAAIPGTGVSVVKHIGGTWDGRMGSVLLCRVSWFRGPQTCAGLLHSRIRERRAELSSALGIRSAEEERAAAVAIVRELEDSFRTTAHEHCGRGSASQEAFELAAEAAAVAVQAIERGEHVGGGSDEA